MIRFFEKDIDETNEIAAIPEVIRAVIKEVKRCKDYEATHCKSDGRPKYYSMSELTEKYSKEPYKTLSDMYDAFEEEFYKLPYSILWKVEACMMTGADIVDQRWYGVEDPDGVFDIGNGDSIFMRDYEGLAYFWDIPTSTEEGGNIQLLIEYVCSKKDLDKFLSAYMKCAGHCM